MTGPFVLPPKRQPQTPSGNPFALPSKQEPKLRVAGRQQDPEDLRLQYTRARQDLEAARERNKQELERILADPNTSEEQRVRIRRLLAIDYGDFWDVAQGAGAGALSWGVLGTADIAAGAASAILPPYFGKGPDLEGAWGIRALRENIMESQSIIDEWKHEHAGSVAGTVGEVAGGMAGMLLPYGAAGKATAQTVASVFAGSKAAGIYRAIAEGTATHSQRIMANMLGGVGLDALRASTLPEASMEQKFKQFAIDTGMSLVGAWVIESAPIRQFFGSFGSRKKAATDVGPSDGSTATAPTREERIEIANRARSKAKNRQQQQRQRKLGTRMWDEASNQGRQEMLPDADDVTIRKDFKDLDDESKDLIVEYSRQYDQIQQAIDNVESAPTEHTPIDIRGIAHDETLLNKTLADLRQKREDIIVAGKDDPDLMSAIQDDLRTVQRALRDLKTKAKPKPKPEPPAPRIEPSAPKAEPPAPEPKPSEPTAEPTSPSPSGRPVDGAAGTPPHGMSVAFENHLEYAGDPEYGMNDMKLREAARRVTEKLFGPKAKGHNTKADFTPVEWRVFQYVYGRIMRAEGLKNFPPLEDTIQDITFKSQFDATTNALSRKLSDVNNEPWWIEIRDLEDAGATKETIVNKLLDLMERGDVKDTGDLFLLLRRGLGDHQTNYDLFVRELGDVISGGDLYRLKLRAQILADSPYTHHENMVEAAKKLSKAFDSFMPQTMDDTLEEVVTGPNIIRTALDDLGITKLTKAGNVKKKQPSLYDLTDEELFDVIRYIGRAIEQAKKQKPLPTKALEDFAKYRDLVRFVQTDRMTALKTVPPTKTSLEKLSLEQLDNLKNKVHVALEKSISGLIEDVGLSAGELEDSVRMLRQMAAEDIRKIRTLEHRLHEGLDKLEIAQSEGRVLDTERSDPASGFVPTPIKDYSAYKAMHSDPDGPINQMSAKYYSELVDRFEASHKSDGNPLDITSVELRALFEQTVDLIGQLKAKVGTRVRVKKYQQLLTKVLREIRRRNRFNNPIEEKKGVPLVTPKKGKGEVRGKPVRGTGPPKDPKDVWDSMNIGFPIETRAAVSGSVVGFFTGLFFGDSIEQRLENAMLTAAGFGMTAGGFRRIRQARMGKSDIELSEAQKKLRNRVHSIEDMPDEAAKGWLSRQEKIYNRLISRSYPLTKLFKTLKLDDLPFRQNAAKLMEMFGIWKRQADAAIYHKPMKFLADGNVVDADSESLTTIVQMVDGDTQNFGEFLIAARSMEMHGNNRGTPPVDIDTAETVFVNAPDKFHIAQKEFLKYQRWLADVMVDAGLISPELRVSFEEDLFYTSLIRIFDEQLPKTSGDVGSGAQKKAKSVRASQAAHKLKTSERKVLNAVEAALENTPTVLRKAEYNRMLVTFANQIETLRNAGYKEMTDYFMRPLSTKGDQQPGMSAAHTQRQMDELQQAMKDVGVDISTTEAQTVARMFGTEPVNVTDGVATFWRNGVEEKWRMHPEIAKAFLSLNSDEFSSLIKFLGMPAQMARVGITASPRFVTFQAFRDNWQFWLNSPSWFADYIPFVDQARGWWHTIRGSPEYKKAVQSGLTGESMTAEALDPFRSSLKRSKSTIEDVKVGRGLKLSEKLVADVKEMSVRKLYTDLIMPLADASRVGAYLRGRGRGLSTTDAVYRAKKIGVNYGERGADRIMANINHTALFINPAFQSVATSVKAFKRNPMMYLTKGFAGITLPSWYIWWAYQDDEEIQELRQTESGRRYWWVRDFENNIRKIPKPILDGQIFGSFVEAALDQTKRDNPQAIQTGLQALLDDSAMHFMPTILTVPYSIASNYNLAFSSPIAPRRTEGLDPEMQRSRGTSDAARIVGSAISPVSSWVAEKSDTDIMRGIARSMSPAGIDYIVRGWGGEVSMELFKAIGQGYKYLTKPGYTVEAEEFPFVHQLYPRFPTAGANSIREFYSHATRLERIYNTGQRKIQSTNGKEVADGVQYITDRMTQYSLAETVKQTRSQLADMRAGIQDIDELKEMPQSERRKIIDSIMLAMISRAKATNRIVRRVMQNSP